MTFIVDDVRKHSGHVRRQTGQQRRRALTTCDITPGVWGLTVGVRVVNVSMFRLGFFHRKFELGVGNYGENLIFE